MKQAVAKASVFSKLVGTEVGKAGIVRYAAAQSAFSVPTKLPVGLLDRQIVDAGEAALQVAEVVEFPVLVAVGAIPLAGIVVEFVLETHGDAVASERPEFFLEAVIEFPIPLAAQKLDDRRAAIHELGAVAPFGVLGVGKRDALGVARIPGVFGGLDFLARGFFRERRERRAWIHVSVWL